MYQRLQITQDGFFFCFFVFPIIDADVNDSIKQYTMKGVEGVN